MYCPGNAAIAKYEAVTSSRKVLSALLVTLPDDATELDNLSELVSAFLLTEAEELFWHLRARCRFGALPAFPAELEFAASDCPPWFRCSTHFVLLGVWEDFFFPLLLVTSPSEVASSCLLASTVPDAAWTFSYARCYGIELSWFNFLWRFREILFTCLICSICARRSSNTELIWSILKHVSTLSLLVLVAKSSRLRWKRICSRAKMCACLKLSSTTAQQLHREKCWSNLHRGEMYRLSKVITCLSCCLTKSLISDRSSYPSNQVATLSGCLDLLLEFHVAWSTCCESVFVFSFSTSTWSTPGRHKHWHTVKRQTILWRYYGIRQSVYWSWTEVIFDNVNSFIKVV